MSQQQPNLKTTHRLPNTNIVIDCWKTKEGSEKFIRFMTVFRMRNEQLEYVKKSNYKIYTSCINKWRLEFHDIPAERIIAIAPGSVIEICDEHAGYSFKVSVIDSNHCAGSCMFLFQGPFGIVLYTGFFRPARSCDPLQDPILESLVQKKLIDVVYIDNSYAGVHCQYPSRADVIEEAIQLIKKHPNHKIIISGNKFGKEEILRDIANSINENIGLSKRKYQELLLMIIHGHSERFSTDRESCRIIVEDKLLCLSQCKKMQVEEGMCIIILLTARYICQKILTGNPGPRLSNLHILPYSSHASHGELMLFLYNLKPRSIKPIILNETENTIIPQKMKDLCYEDRDSATLLNSDFYFGSYADALNSMNEYGSAAEIPIQTSKVLVQDNSNYVNNNVAMEACPLSGGTAENSSCYDNEETGSVDSNIYHESQTSAFKTFFERMEEENYDYNEDEDYRDTRDSFSIDDSSDTTLISESVSFPSDSSAASTTARSEGSNVILSISENGIQNIPQTCTSFLDNVMQSSGEKYEESSDDEPSIVSNTKNYSKTQDSTYNKVFDDEISSNDIIGSDGLLDKHTQEKDQSDEPEEAIITNLAVTDSRNIRLEPEGSTTRNNEESVNNEKRQLNTCLYHWWLKMKPENFEHSGLTGDMWKRFQGYQF